MKEKCWEHQPQPHLDRVDQKEQDKYEMKKGTVALHCNRSTCRPEQISETVIEERWPNNKYTDDRELHDSKIRITKQEKKWWDYLKQAHGKYT